MARPTLRERLTGSPRRLGWWTLPVFLVVGLAGAVMAGALAVVYYSQQVNGLRDETRAGREALQEAVDQVSSAGDDALAAIESEVEAVRESLTRDLPVADAAELGVVVVRALVGSAPADPEPAPASPPAGDGEAQGAPDVRAQEQPSEDPPAEPGPTAAPEQPRVGVAFAVAVDGPTTFLATSHALVADPGARAGVVEFVEVVAPSGVVRGVVHSWDEGRDLALLRVDVGGIPIAPWRNREDPVAPGERLTLAGLTPTSDSVLLNATVGYGDVTLLVADTPRVDFLRGAPVVDQDGRVVAVYTPDYRPFGSAAGDGQALAPVQLLCERMLRNCEQLEAPASEGEAPSEDG